MSVLLLTMGPQLGITADLPVVGVGGAGVIRFRAIGATGPVKWTIVDSTLPAEWDSALNPDGDAVTLTTSDAETAGTFRVTVRAVDSARIPVVRSFDVRVMALPLTISGAFPNWAVGQPVTGALTISGGVPPYSGLTITSGALPAGVSLSIVGNQIVPSGTPLAIASGSVEITVSDSLSVHGVTSVNWEVEIGPELARRWRLWITSTQQASYTSAAEIELRATPNGVNLATGGVASASSEFITPGEYHIAGNAFDGNAATFWNSASAYPYPPWWIAYELATAAQINEVAIRARADIGIQGPLSFSVQSWNGTEWVNEWSVSDLPYWSPGEQRVFTRP